MNEFLLFAVVVVYLAICYGRPTQTTNSGRQNDQNERPSRATAARQND
jgi:hypothetical protein